VPSQVPSSPEGVLHILASRVSKDLHLTAYYYLFDIDPEYLVEMAPTGEVTPVCTSMPWNCQQYDCSWIEGRGMAILIFIRLYYSRVIFADGQDMNECTWAEWENRANRTPTDLVLKTYKYSSPSVFQRTQKLTSLQSSYPTHFRHSSLTQPKRTLLQSWSSIIWVSCRRRCSSRELVFFQLITRFPLNTDIICR
jgi:hypothetical protein